MVYKKERILCELRKSSFCSKLLQKTSYQEKLSASGKTKTISKLGFHRACKSELKVVPEAFAKNYT